MTIEEAVIAYELAYGDISNSIDKPYRPGEHELLNVLARAAGYTGHVSFYKILLDYPKENLPT